MDQAKAMKQAAKQSKTLGPQFVVWVPDQGRDIYTGAQMLIWAKFVFVEATFVGGVQVSTEAVTA